MDIIHKVGDVVRCVHSSGYHLTTGKEYTVVDVWDSATMENGYTYPSYVVVRDDGGVQAVCHHHRFHPVPGDAS